MKKENVGVFQLENGNWCYRYCIIVDGEKRTQRRTKDDDGKPFKTEKQAIRARNQAIAREQMQLREKSKKKIRKTVKEVYKEYCENGRHGKAYATIRKQDSLWNNHIADRFGKRYIDDISVAEINDYLAELYYVENRAYKYVESFLKMFYLIFGQAYSRDYISANLYNKLCKNKDIRIHMPKMKTDEETDVVVFSNDEIEQLDEYFAGTNAETAYLIGKYCGLRINECYGLKWSNINFEDGTINVDRQMQYQNGLIKLVPLKTRNAKRIVHMNSKLKEHLKQIYTVQSDKSQELIALRRQNQTFIEDINGDMISSLELVNCLKNGKIQTINSMKFHARKINATTNICFKYHYLRHSYGTRLANMNTPSHILRRQMGHSNIDTTMRYYLAVSTDGVDLLKDNLEQM